MTHHDRGHYSKKHSSDRKIDPKITEAAKDRASNRKLPCATAFTIVDDLQVSPAEVGFIIDVLEFRLIKCQLGIFGYSPKKKIIKPADSVASSLEEAIKEELKNDRLSCAGAWEIAKRLGLRKMEVSAACETLKIKISTCQLGAF